MEVLVGIRAVILELCIDAEGLMIYSLKTHGRGTELTIWWQGVC